MKYTIGLILLVIIISCNLNKEELIGHQLSNEGDILKISYQGSGDVVQFLMFQGPRLILKKHTSGIFEGQLAIPNLDDGIFSYDILVHEQDSTGRMIDLNYRPHTDGERHFIWVGKNRTISYSKENQLKGELTSKIVNSEFLESERELTTYTPQDFSKNTPIIYCTDGTVVKSYAPYLDKLISAHIIMPVKLVGVHSSQENRYEEYVTHGIENDFFDKHEDFFFEEVIPQIEGEIQGWKGKRYIYGFSNGAAFCMYAGINHPEKFDEIIAFSTVDYISEFMNPIEFKFQDYPNFYMGAGRYEERTFINNVNFVDKMKTKSVNVEFKEFISGHDYKVWEIEFFEYIQSRFKP